MALQLYSASAVYIANSQLTENAQVGIDRESGFQRVLTIPKGFAGVSAGARFMMIRIMNAVPSVGFEYDPGPAMEGLIPVPVTIFAASSSLITTGFVEKDAFQHAVNGEAKIDIEFVCLFAQWE